MLRCIRFSRTTSVSLLAASFLAAGSMHAQTFAHAEAGSAAATTTPNAAWHDTVPDKLVSAKIRDGVLSVDGLVAKVRLNYEIRNAAYIYVFLPGTGTAIVSMSPLPNGERVKDLFRGSKMAFTIGGHSFELASQGNIAGEGASAGYVMLDRTTALIARAPMVGYGMTTRAPYVWPVSGKPATAGDTAYSTHLPANMLPRTEATPLR
jgi:hypothetical protein